MPIVLEAAFRNSLFFIEIKSGMTVTRDYFKGLNHFKALFDSRMPNGSGLVYDGTDSQNRSDVSVVPLDKLYQLLSKRIISFHRFLHLNHPD